MTDSFETSAARAAQNPESGALPEDYFSVFDLPRLLTVDVAALEKRFYKLSRRVHPDQFATASAEEQQHATDRSSLLNDAYRTLKEPVARTRYLLQLEGASVEDDSEKDRAAARAEGRPREQKIPPDLLGEVFELNMQLEELQAGGDDPELKKQLQSARVAFEQQLSNCDDELDRLGAQWDMALHSQDEARKTRAKEALIALLNRRNYIRNLVRDVQLALEEEKF